MTFLSGERGRWAAALLISLMLHCALIFIFGGAKAEKKPEPARRTTKANDAAGAMPPEIPHDDVPPEIAAEAAPPWADLPPQEPGRGEH